MSIAMIAAGALLGTVGQPSDPKVSVVLPGRRVYQWMVVPGSGVFPVPTPFVMVVPLGKLQEKVANLTRSRQELHIIIQSEREGVITETFTQAVLDGIKNVIEDARTLEKATLASTEPCKKSDPKAVIDPIVTGF